SSADQTCLAALACLQGLVAASRWIELPQLDRLVRFARGDHRCDARSLADLAGEGADAIGRLRAAYQRLSADTQALLADVASPREPTHRGAGVAGGWLGSATPGGGRLLGVGVEFRAATTLREISLRGGLQVAPGRARELAERAEREYARASETLYR